MVWLSHGEAVSHGEAQGAVLALEQGRQLEWQGSWGLGQKHGGTGPAAHRAAPGWGGGTCHVGAASNVRALGLHSGSQGPVPGTRRSESSGCLLFPAVPRLLLQILGQELHLLLLECLQRLKFQSG